MPETVLRHRDAEALVENLASDLVARLRERQATGTVPQIVLTGGSLSRSLHRRLRDAAGVDWGRVEIWWGDERYVAPDDAERNAGQACADLLHHVPVDPDLVHPMPADDGTHPDVEAAAAAYGALLESRLGRREPWFDLLLLGIGPDGHCASLFPGHPEVHATGIAVAVRDSPKPPPVRISLTMPVLLRARAVWFLASGQGKADAVAASVRGGAGNITDVPAAGPRGLDETRWYVDGAAAASR